MPIATLSSREFNQGASEAKRAANNGSVFITDQGKPAHVLLSFDDYQKLTKQRRNARLGKADANATAWTESVDAAVALRGERDALIAATALVHGMTVVTRNVADFKPAGVTLINPWGESQ